MTNRRVVPFVALLALLSASTLGAQSIYDPYLFVTHAGLAGSSGITDGTGTAARFSSPTAIAIDAARNLYLCDTGNHTIRMITPAGVVSTFAGSPGIHGTEDGTASGARFFSPQGITRDGAGNLYIADTDNHTIRKITAGGSVTTIAGTAGVTGFTDGIGSAARFHNPIGLAMDSSGNLFVGDAFNHTIRKVTPLGAVTTFAGLAETPGGADGSGDVARFNFPHGLAVDGSDNIYVADTTNGTIRKITPAGVVSTVAGVAGMAGSDDASGAAARFFNPRALAIDGANNILVGDTNNSTIRKIASTALVRTAAGLATTDGSTNGVASAALFRSPQGIAVDGAGNVYVGDTGNNTIRIGGPQSAYGMLSIYTLPNTHVFLTGHAPPDTAVGIEAAPDVTAMLVPITTVTADADGLFQYEDTASGSFPRRFYLSLVPPAP